MSSSSGPTYPTLVASLEARHDDHEAGYTHYTRAGAAPRFVSHAALFERARRIAAALQARGLKRGDRVALILQGSAEFVDAIYGAMIAGVVPVPIYPPLSLGALRAYLENTTHIVRRAGCTLVLTDARVRTILGAVMSHAPSVREIVALADLLADVPEHAAPTPVTIKPDDIAFLQFTSGSTSRPKGVALTHENLAANIQAIGRGLRLHRDTAGLSWLPLYHDMGLIGFVFTPLYFGVRGIEFLSPLMFLKRPSVWLRHISSFRATVVFAPNFAWGLATKRVKERELEGVDLSSVEVAGCGAEPIQFHTLNAFAARFKPYGFRRTMFLPCYGLAEHSLAVTFTGIEDDLACERLDVVALSAGRAETRPEPEMPEPPEQPDATSRIEPPARHHQPEEPGVIRVVRCGRPFPGHELKIATAAGAPLPERQVGHIMLRGPSIMRGYFNDPEESARALVDGWLETGDLGYLAEGELFVCGRSKELLIVNGRNFYPQDIEWQASQVAGVRVGNVIAFGLHDADAARERVILAVETKVHKREHESLRKQIKARILDTLALRVDELVLLPPGSLPKTSSGKLRRAEARARFLNADLNADRASSLKLLRQLASARWTLFKTSRRERE